MGGIRNGPATDSKGRPNHSLNTLSQAPHSKRITQKSLPPRANGVSTNNTKPRNSITETAQSDSSSRASSAKEVCSRNPVGKFKALSAKETFVSSAGSILCCSSFKSSDIRNCNKKLWNKHEIEVNGKLWDGVMKLGVHGGEEDEVYVEHLCINERKDREAMRLREQNNQVLS
ncbi:hypothetical protein L195_g045459 [Trifolium pratense]|uniref:Uncharacterized protein n=1 Tax=Trifolium pratense TaxID=57577 RepID=A0A2K3MEX8_TRIPR|nr:hypothetical protein L195_g045459 [Trifolium pratense]